MNDSRTSKSIKNAKVALLFYLFQLVLSFFSRKAFFDYLGSEILGLNTTAANLLGLLNLTELGIATSIGYFLYQPLYENDRAKIQKLISLQGWIYRRIACCIIVGSVVLMFFFPQIFGKTGLPLWYAYSTYTVLLFSALLGYFINYKQILLNADQKGYKVQQYVQGVTILKTIIQIIGITHISFPFFFWLGMEVVGALISAIILKWVLRKEYPWLKTEITSGRIYAREYPEVLKKTGQVFFHKIAELVLNQSGPLIIYGFTNLTTVALYGNYVLVVGKIAALIGTVFNSTGAAIGNLVASKDRDRIVRVFWELYDFRLCSATVMLLCLYHLTTPFIIVWLGEEYCLSDAFLLLYIVLAAIMMTRSTVDSYISAYGLFKDIWAPAIEAVLNIGCSVAFGLLWGLNGIILGVLTSLVLIVLCWKPYFLFSRGIGVSAWRYFYPVLLRYGCVAVLFIVTDSMASHLLPQKVDSIGQWLKGAVSIGTFSGCLSVMLFYLFFPGFKDFCSRCKILLKK